MPGEPVMSWGGLRILVVPAKSFPSEHPMLEAVYASRLPACGHHVEWVMWGGPEDRARWHGTPVHLVGRPTGAARVPVAWFELLRTVARAARRGRFDLIQVRNSTAVGCLALWLRRRTRARFVFQMSFPVLEGVIAAFGGRRGARARIRGIAARLAIPVRGWMLRRADLVLAISDEMRDGLVADGLPAERVVAFPLGADRFDPPPPREVEAARARLDLGPDPLVLYAGAIAPPRRLAVLVRAAARVLEAHPSARFVLVGPAAEGEDERLRSLAEGLGINGAVQVVPPVSHREVLALTAAAAVAVSPIPPTELYRVASPTKVVEALALGCPVVVSPIRDQAELVHASGGGVVAPFEAEAFAAAISSLLSDPVGARSMGRSGAAYVRRHRSYERLSQTLLDAYRAMLAEVRR